MFAVYYLLLQISFGFGTLLHSLINWLLTLTPPSGKTANFG